MTMTAYEILTALTQQPDPGTDVVLDWQPASAASHIECKTDFFNGWRPTRSATDLFLVGAAAYCVDKIAARADARDAWTRRLDLRFPAHESETFNISSLAYALRFLTGDHWQLVAHDEPLD